MTPDQIREKLISEKYKGMPPYSKEELKYNRMETMKQNNDMIDELFKQESASMLPKTKAFLAAGGTLKWFKDNLFGGKLKMEREEWEKEKKTLLR